MPGLKSDLSKFRSWNFGTKADKSEVVRKLEQIRIYSEDFQKKRVIFVTLVKVTKIWGAKRSVLSVVHCTLVPRLSSCIWQALTRKICEVSCLARVPNLAEIRSPLQCLL